ncbi:hypothetical protein [Pontibacter roseus]|uniref:hypothetical protein n=1 Tax=Pontibacter roseus TaxID=336989 RepID=UPI000381DA0D|nr:hypothetical protein [Pontibacter roseus]
MKNILFTIIFLTLSNVLFAQVNPEHVWVDGYTKSNGTYVSGHYKTKSNETVNDNFSTIGNINPYTGQPGWKPRDSKVVYDSYYNYDIPSSYIYKSKADYHLEVVNSLNLLTNLLDEHLPSEIDRPYWTLNNSKLYTRFQMNVWEADEEYFAKAFLSLYFKEADLLSGNKELIDLLIKVGLGSVNVKTPNHTFEITLDEVKRFENQ